MPSQPPDERYATTLFPGTYSRVGITKQGLCELALLTPVASKKAALGSLDSRADIIAAHSRRASSPQRAGKPEICPRTCPRVDRGCLGDFPPSRRSLIRGKAYPRHVTCRQAQLGRDDLGRRQKMGRRFFGPFSTVETMVGHHPERAKGRRGETRLKYQVIRRYLLVAPRRGEGVCQ